jgi:hypothetical protein
MKISKRTWFSARLNALSKSAQIGAICGFTHRLTYERNRVQIGVAEQTHPIRVSDSPGSILHAAKQKSCNNEPNPVPRASQKGAVWTSGCLDVWSFRIVLPRCLVALLPFQCASHNWK